MKRAESIARHAGGGKCPFYHAVSTVRSVEGAAPTRDVSKLSMLPFAYAIGCLDKRDAAAARRTLAAFANVHGDKGYRIDRYLFRWSPDH